MYIGAPVAVPVNVDRERVRRLLVEAVIPSIKCVWPGMGVWIRFSFRNSRISISNCQIVVWPGRNKTVCIQQDNAGPHCLASDTDAVANGQEDGWNISLKSQFPNSSDLNVLDLAFSLEHSGVAANQSNEQH